MNFDTLLNNNKPQDKRFRDTRFFLGHINRVPRGLTVPPNFIILTHFKQQKRKLHEGLTLLTLT